MYFRAQKIIEDAVQRSDQTGGKARSLSAEFLTVFLGRDPVLSFKDILKIALAGKAQVLADFTDGLVRVVQETPGFFQLAAHDIAADIKAQLPLEFLGQGGPLHVQLAGDHLGGDALVYMVGDVLEAVKDFPGHSLRDPGLRHSSRKVEQGVGIQQGDGSGVGHFLHLLNIGVGKLVGSLNIQAAPNGASGCLADGNDKNILGLPDEIGRYPAFCKRGNRLKKGLQTLQISPFHQSAVFQLKIIGIMILFMLLSLHEDGGMTFSHLPLHVRV